MPREKTKAQILDYVSTFSDVHGFAPTYREIARAVGLRSPSTVFDYIKVLKEEGKLDMTEKQPRAVALYRRIPMKVGETQRLRVELSDGGFLYVDCSVKKHRCRVPGRHAFRHHGRQPPQGQHRQRHWLHRRQRMNV